MSLHYKLSLRFGWFYTCDLWRCGDYDCTVNCVITTVNCVFTDREEISIAEKYHVDQIYLFGSYARGEAGIDSDLDFLVYGGDNFKLTMIFALAEELREVLDKKVDVFEIHEIDQESEFYNAIMKY